jgi:hypothetical protein
MHSITTWMTPCGAPKWFARALAAARDSIEPAHSILAGMRDDSLADPAPFGLRYHGALRTSAGTRPTIALRQHGKGLPTAWFQINDEVSVEPSSFRSSQGVLDGNTSWHFKNSQALAASWENELDYLPLSIDVSRYSSC